MSRRVTEIVKNYNEEVTALQDLLEEAKQENLRLHEEIKRARLERDAALEAACHVAEKLAIMREKHGA